MDSCVTPVRFNLSIIQTTDFFYPIVEDPYLTGKIACANVLSDLYAMGVTECDNMLMILGIPEQMKPEERNAAFPYVIKGFKDCAAEADTYISGGDTKVASWCAVGGVATAVCRDDEYLMPNRAVAGDVLVLTKPLGTNVAVTAYQNLDKTADMTHREAITARTNKAYQRAISTMLRLNRTAARLMKVFNVHAATDVTGFGLLGHAENLVSFQLNNVSFTINNFPVIADTVRLAHLNSLNFLGGRVPETSGGLLMCMSRSDATEFCKEFLRLEGHACWIIGTVDSGDKTAKIIKKPRVIEVPAHETPDDLVW